MVLSSFSLSGKTAIVTGAGSGIGKVIAIGFAEAGADVAIISRTEDDLRQTASEIEKFGRKAYIFPADVTNTSEIIHTIDLIKEGAGKIDILVNNVGMNVQTPAFDVAEAEWQKIVDTNLKSAFVIAQKVGRIFKEQGRGGKIINISSVAGHVALRTGVVYGATKAALIQMTKVLAFEWGKFGINVNAIAPWYFKTRRTEKLLQDEEYVKEILTVTPIKRIGELHELVGPAVLLASDAGSYITGQTLFVDGGMTIHGF